MNQNLALSLINQIVEKRALVEQLEDQINELEAQFLETHDPGTYKVGSYKVTVKNPPQRLNARKVQAAFPVSERPDLYTPKLDTRKVRNSFAPKDLEEQGFYTYGKRQVLIK